MKIYWIVWTIILLIIEIPLLKKLLKYKKEFDIIRETAVIILIILTVLIIYTAAKSGLYLYEFVVK